MAFTGICAIHDSNPRIWRRLMNYGIHPNSCLSAMTARNKDNKFCVVVERGSFFCVKEDDLCDFAYDGEVYDCDDNEDLFFALAVLRDDSDINQWFIYDNRSWNDDNPKRYWFVCRCESVEDDMFIDSMYVDCDKATEAELIAHFNGDDDDEIMN